MSKPRKGRPEPAPNADVSEPPKARARRPPNPITVTVNYAEPMTREAFDAWLKNYCRAILEAREAGRLRLPADLSTTPNPDGEG